MLVLLLGPLAILNGQVREMERFDSLDLRDFQVLESLTMDGESMPHSTIKEVVIIPEIKFRNKRHRRRYGRLVNNIKRVYPYALLAREKMEEMESHLVTLSSEREQKAYIDSMEADLFGRFEGELRKLTITQGKILVKLIDRETGDTSYEVLREFKGGFTAFFWQSIARLFGNNLKMEYDRYGEDALIEQVVVMIERGYI